MRKKFLVVLMVFVLLLIQFVPIVLASSNIEEKENNKTTNLLEENENVKKEVDKKEETNEDESKETAIEENKKQEIKLEETKGVEVESKNNKTEETNIKERKNDIEDETKKEKIELEKNEEVTPIRGIENNNQEKNIEEVSFYIDFAERKINTYYKNDIYYFFIPQEIEKNHVVISYTGNVTEVSAGIINDNKTITNDFSQNDTISITANEQQYQIKVMQSDLPSLSIKLNNTTLDTIKSGNKETKYPGNNVDLKDPLNSKNNLSISNVEIKGRGNFTWN